MKAPVDTETKSGLDDELPERIWLKRTHGENGWQFGYYCDRPQDDAFVEYVRAATRDLQPAGSLNDGVRCRACDKGYRLGANNVHYDDDRGGQTWGVCDKYVAACEARTMTFTHCPICGNDVSHDAFAYVNTFRCMNPRCGWSAVYSLPAAQP